MSYVVVACKGCAGEAAPGELNCWRLMALWGELTPYSQLPVQPGILGCFFPVVVVVVVVVGALRKSRWH
jgi:hypothetical protein